MLLGHAFERFVEQAPVCVGVRAVLETALNAEAVDALFGHTAERELLISKCVDPMTTVVCRTHRSAGGGAGPDGLHCDPPVGSPATHSRGPLT